ncbi:MAG TPA: YifB family Mg chelatase-like AAA ATPase [Alphaproteobacteria bacterium]|nr:YifB family Mg chelatase-like AAA ATPase [Alphaproteobacteria bacterium]
MVARVKTVALEGLKVTTVPVEVQVTPGVVSFNIIGLPSGAVRESRDRVRGAFHALGLAFPAKRITVNLAPANVEKDGSHYDLPIALGLLMALGIVPSDAADNWMVLGELGLDGRINPVVGCLPAAIHALGEGVSALAVPPANAAEAAWAAPEGELAVFGPENLGMLIKHLRGDEVMSAVRASGRRDAQTHTLDLADVRGQESAKRALEIAAAGGHHLLMSGPPGSGKSMLAARLPGLLPPLSAAEALEVSLIHSVAGMIGEEGLVTTRPFRDPHHSASPASLTGGGIKAKPGEMSLSHRGILFLDELPEFPRGVLETLRQPLENGNISIARASAHVTYPARFQLVAAMNPCRCGHLGDAAKGCKKQPGCALEYQNKLSGPLLDRFDLRITVPGVAASDLSLPPAKEGSAQVSARVAAARLKQQQRYGKKLTCNAELHGKMLDDHCPLDDESRKLLNHAADKLGLSARGYHRIIRVARTIADLAGEEHIGRTHVAEALAYRGMGV